VKHGEGREEEEDAMAYTFGCTTLSTKMLLLGGARIKITD
jgi:hypothetical protein